MKVSGVADTCREKAFAVFALAFAVELFPPFGNIVEIVKIVDKNFYSETGSRQNIARNGILGCRTIDDLCFVKSHSRYYSGAFKYFFNVVAFKRNRKNTNPRPDASHARTE